MKKPLKRINRYSKKKQLKEKLRQLYVNATRYHYFICEVLMRESCPWISRNYRENINQEILH